MMINSQRFFLRFKCWVLGCLVSLFVFASASASAAGTAKVNGPIAGAPGAVATTLFDVSQLGYAQYEFFGAGTAVSYEPVGSLSADGFWQVTAADSAAFTTRLIVYRPADAGSFNGTVYVEWLNVSAGQDFAPDWLYAHNEIIRQGAAYVGITAQAVGVNTAKLLNPARYAALNHPGDSFSYDIFSQVGEAIRNNSNTVLGGLTPNKLIAIGESQSANRLSTYLNAVQPLDNTYDGIFIHSRIGGDAPLSQSPQASVPVPMNSLLRTDQVPVLQFQTETDVLRQHPDQISQGDSPLVKTWHVAGTAHADSYLLNISFTDANDRANAARAVFDSMLNPSADTILGACVEGINGGGAHYVLEAALDSFTRWVVEEMPPASAPRYAFSSLAPPAFAYDAVGNVLGGIRTPFVDVPVAKLSGVPVPGSPGFCVLFGSTTPFTQDQLADMYPNHGKFVSRWNKATKSAIRKGYILAEEEEALKQVAAESEIGK